MQKDFNNWIVAKKDLEYQGREELTYHEREIWWCSIGVNLGDEQDGKNQLFERPVLVVRKFNRRIAWVLPMSSKIKDGVFYYQLNHNDKTYSVLLSQLRLVSVKRFRRFIRKISPHQFSLVQSKLIRLIKQ